MSIQLLNTIDAELLRDHPVCRGEFVALVFSGSKKTMSEIAGEPTFLTKRKFALPDPRLGEQDDFAHHAATSLDRWPSERIEPIDGICFVFDDLHHPAVELLSERGASRGDHFVTVTEISADPRERSLQHRLSRFLETVEAPEPIAVLGYGQQGGRIVQILLDHFGLPELRILEHGRDSRRRAREDGLVLIDAEEVESCGSVICTPLHHHHRLGEIAEAARRRGLPVFENCKGRTPPEFFRRYGGLCLDASARRALRWQGMHLVEANHGFAVGVSIVRDDIRRLAGTTFAHLHAQPSFSLSPGTPTLDLSRSSPFDAFGSETLVASRGVYVSAIEGAAPFIAAARSFCLQEWPEATEAVLPSPHPLEMGATSLERLLLRCIGRCEIAMASQTPAQQAALGVIARACAADTPIVEIGSALGGSALLMAAATERHRPPIISIDPDTASRDVMRFIFEREGHLDRLDQRIATSDEAISGLKDRHERVGVVFFDGLHTEMAARRDFENYAPLVRPGGALLFHDAEPAWQGVLQVVTRHAASDRRFRLRAMIDSLAVFERLL